MRVRVDHHAEALHAGAGHVFDPQGARSLGLAGGDARAVRAVLDGASDVHAGPEAVVEDDLRHPVAVSVELLADMGQAGPLNRVLQSQQHRIVAQHVDVLGVPA